MSCKVLRAAQADRAQRLQWPGPDSPPAGGPAFSRAPWDRSAGRSPGDEETRVRDAHRAGFAEGESAARREIEPVVERLARAIESLASMRGRLRRLAEEDVVRLAMAIARRILRRELAVDPQAVEGLAQAALQRLQSEETARVRVHPALAQALVSALGRVAPGQAIEVVADAGREAGDVVFETERGNLDASVETQLQEIERGLADRLRR